MKFSSLAAIAVSAVSTLALAQRGGGRDAAPTAPPPAARPAPRDAGPRAAPPSTDAPVDLPGLYFRTCDYDGNGWVSFAEAKASMNVDRPAFAVYDTDGDGRIGLEEYTGRYLTIVTRGGAFAPPIDKVVSRRIPQRTAPELLTAFDTDKDGALDHRDVQRALAEYGAQGVDATKILTMIDDDKTGLIESHEVQALLDVLVPPALSAARKKVGSIAALFDTTEPRVLGIDSTPQPARLRGPVSTFRRLDFDASGSIAVDDLEELQRPLQIPIRASAVIATLDLDGDGALSKEEFAASMR